MEIGTIIEVKYNINFDEAQSPEYKHVYYKLCSGDFEIDVNEIGVIKLKGLYFLCIGSDFWVGCSGDIAGFEKLEMEHKIIETLPESIKL